MVSDEQIIEGCLAGKRRAYNMLYRKYASVMMAICMRYCKNHNDAEDVLQEGFIKVFSHLGKFRHEGSFEGWIKRIMIHAAIDHYQDNLQHAYHSDVDDPITAAMMGDLAGHDPDSPQAENITKEKLMSLIQSLPDGYRMVFNLYALEGMSHREIAETLKISENTSETQLMKARRNLRDKLTELIKKLELKNHLS